MDSEDFDEVAELMSESLPMSALQHLIEAQKVDREWLNQRGIDCLTVRKVLEQSGVNVQIITREAMIRCLEGTTATNPAQIFEIVNPALDEEKNPLVLCLLSFLQNIGPRLLDP